MQRYFEKLKSSTDLRLSFNFPVPDSLIKTCHKELDQIRDRREVLKELDEGYDTESLAKYMSDSDANFARATVDTLCAIQYLSLYTGNSPLQDRIELNLYEAPPFFRGTITEKEIAFVQTLPWVPGMLGKLHVSRAEKGWHNFSIIRSSVNDEIKAMAPKRFEFDEAKYLLRERAKKALREASTKRNAGKSEIESLTNFIDAVQTRDPDKSVEESLSSIIELRTHIRKLFASCFYRLDEGMKTTEEIHNNPSHKRNKDICSNSDVVIITAKEIERDAVCKYLCLTNDNRIFLDNRVYWCKLVPMLHDEHKTIRVSVTQCGDQANVSAALATNNAIKSCNPKLIIFVGIAGGGSKDVNIGDACIAEHVYYYERGKEDHDGIIPEPYMYPAHSQSLEIAKSMKIDEADFPSGGPSPKKLVFGVIASGEKVINSRVVKEKLVSNHRKIKCFEMEGYGFEKAVWENASKIPHLVIRGISDDAENKNDDWQSIAAETAAFVASKFISDYFCLVTDIR